MRTIEIKTTQPFHKNKATIPTKISSLFQSEWFDFSFQFSSAFTRKKSTRGTAKGVDVGYGCVSIHRAFIGSWGTMTSLRTNNCAPLIEFGLSLYLFCGVTRLTDFSSASCRSMRLLIFLFSSFFFSLTVAFCSKRKIQDGRRNPVFVLAPISFWWPFFLHFSFCEQRKIKHETVKCRPSKVFLPFSFPFYFLIALRLAYARHLVVVSAHFPVPILLPKKMARLTEIGAKNLKLKYCPPLPWQLGHLFF